MEKLVPGAKFKFVTFKGGGEAVLRSRAGIRISPPRI